MNQPKSVFDFLRARGEEFFTQISDELMQNPQFLRAMQAAWKGKERIDDAVSQALRSMNVPTRAEFKKVMARVETLERELADQRRGIEVLQAEVKKLANERAAVRASQAGGPAPSKPVVPRAVLKKKAAPAGRGRSARASAKSGGTPAAE